MISITRLKVKNAYTQNNNILREYQVFTDEVHNSSYFELKNTFTNVDDIFYRFVQENNTSSVRSIYREYLKYPQLPRKVEMTEKEIKLRINFIFDHYPLLHDIRDEREFQALTLIFGEYKVSLCMKESKSREPVFEKVISFKTLFDQNSSIVPSIVKTNI